MLLSTQREKNTPPNRLSSSRVFAIRWSVDMKLLKLVAMVFLNALVLQSATALTPPVETGQAIQTISNRGTLAPMLDFDLDRFERGHVAMIAPTNTALSTGVCVVRYLRHDGMVWRNNAVNEFACDPNVFSTQRGLIASALSERDAPLPIFNILHVELGAAPNGVSRIWMARVRGNAVLSTDVIATEAVDRGIQLEAAPDGRLHALWRTPLGAIRHAIRTTNGTWSIQTLGIVGAPASAPATAMSDDGRLLLGFVVNGEIGLWQHQNNAWTTLTAPLLQGVRPPIAVHYRPSTNGAEMGVAAINNMAGDQVFYFRGNAQGFPSAGTPTLIGNNGSFRLLDRRALPNQSDLLASAWVALEVAGQTRLVSLPTTASNPVSIGQAAYGGWVQGLALRGTRQFSVAFDTNGNRNVQWHQSEHWSLKMQAAPGTLDLLTHVLDRDGSPLLLVRDSHAMQLGSWSEANNRFEFTDIPSNLMPQSTSPSMAYQFDANTTLLSVAFEHTSTQKLHVISRLNGGDWQTEYAGEVDSPGSGNDAQIAIDDDFQRFVVHINDASSDRLLLTRYGGPLSAPQSSEVDTTTSDLSQSNPRIAVVPETGDLYLSYQKSRHELRLMLRRFQGFFISQSITHTDVVGEHHALALGALGEPALVFSLRNGNQTRLQYRYKFNGQWNEELLRPAAEIGALSSIALTLKNQSPFLARVMRMQSNGAPSVRQLIFEQRRVGFSPSVLPWRAQQFGNFAQVSSLFALDSDVGDHLMFFEGSAGPRLVNALRLHQMDDEGNDFFSPLPPRPRAGQTMFCPCTGINQSEVLIAICDGLIGPSTTSDLEFAPPVSGAEINELRGLHVQHRSMSQQLRSLFNTTPAGRYYLSLHAAHGDEIFALTLRNPRMMVSRFRTLMSFTPGLMKLATGNGAQERMTPEMLVQARNVWMEWRDFGSPALRATMQSELTRLNNLTVFNNMTFEQWFQSLTVGTASPQIFRDGFE
jgi:hypothetical protein